MARRTRSQAQHFGLPPPPADPTQEHDGQPNLNNNCAEEVQEHCPGKKLMITEADDNTNLEELTRRINRLEDMIGTVQTTINQLNQFLIQATRQGIQLFPN